MTTRLTPEKAPPVTTVVVPCFNEARRLRAADIAALVARAGVRVVLVDDGSTDATPAVLETLRRDLVGVDVERLRLNSGKAEAVRIGMLRAVADDSAAIAFCDADMATPVDELLRLDDLLRADPTIEVLLGSRVALLGHRVDRSVTRHYLGRLFATAASLVLRTRVYDTQCGAKFFRNTAALRTALSEPFHSRWSFDVELLGRLLGGGHGAGPLDESAMVEVPLQSWRDIGGSKLTAAASLRAGAELMVISHALKQWRRDADRPDLTT